MLELPLLYFHSLIQVTLNAPEIKIDDTTTTEDVAAAEIKEEKVEEKEDIIEEVMDNS